MYSDTSVFIGNTSTSSLRKESKPVADASLAVKADITELGVPRRCLSSLFHKLIPADRAEAIILAVQYKNSLLP